MSNTLWTLTFGTADIPNGRLAPSQVGALIGKGAQGAKACISDSWKKYKMLQKSENKVQEERPSLRIIFHPLKNETEVNDTYPEQVWIEIVSESDALQKISQMVVKNHCKDIVAQSTLGSQEYLVEFPQRLIGQLIGKKASGLNRLLASAIRDGSNTMIDPGDIKTAQTARLRINFGGRATDVSSQSTIDYVEERDNRSFIGWPPAPEDELVEFISITVTFNKGAEPFNDIGTYSDRLRSVIADRVQQIVDGEEDQMDEINACLGFDED
jgi:hypothetical protein|tara:strand:- start:62 stop:868 length:807 start_codon:yes stop_codon:yes gene_type:complete